MVEQPDSAQKTRRKLWLAFLAIGLALLIGGMAIGTFVLADIWRAGRSDTSLKTDLAVPEKSVAELLWMVEENPNDTSALFEIGRRFYQAGYWRDAVSILTRMVEADPDNQDPNIFMARVGIGNSNFNLKNYAEAKAAWDAALAINPNDAQLRFNLGVYYATISPPDKEAAKAEWEKVITLVPGTDLATAAAKYIETYTTAQPPPTPVPPSVPTP